METSQEEALKDLVRKYRRLADRLINEGRDYTDNLDCVFCSGYEGYKSADEDGSGNEIRHSPKCPIHEAEELAAVEILP